MKRRRASKLLATGLVCALLPFSFRTGAFQPARAEGDEVPATAAESEGTSREAPSGPTLKLNYTRETFEKNPIATFMYFVPLISLTAVDRQTSARNAQEVRIVSYEENIKENTFYVACEFEIRGEGFHRNTFNPAGMIAAHIGDVQEDETLKGILNYVNFEGDGLGRIQAVGTIEGTTRTVTGVDLRFNVGGHMSPVTIGLYDVAPVDGQYTYENRSNQAIARVNTLSFRKSDTSPAMGITVASIRKVGATEGFFSGFISRFKGSIANLVITPPRIEELGNETMLRLGLALLNKDPEFTFPVAKNLEEDKIVEP